LDRGDSGDQGLLRLKSARERFRLYIDESGDHVFRYLEEPGHRYLCLLGCWFRGQEYLEFHRELEALKQRHLPHNPDEPVILHRKDMVNRRGCFWRFRDRDLEESFNNDLMGLIERTDFRIVGVVIDKKELQARYYPSAADPYHLAMGFLLQRYCGWLNHINRVGDVMAESRGGREDRRLKDSYAWVYQRGIWQTRAEFFQRALTTNALKVKRKSDNIAGLQLADLLAHPVRQLILRENGRIPTKIGAFTGRLLPFIYPKFNRHIYDGHVEGYGKVLYPK